MYLILLPCVLALFMMSVVETAGHKTAAFSVVFSRLLCVLKAYSWLQLVCLFFFFFYRAEKQRRAEEAQRALAETARCMAAAEIARLQGGDCGPCCQQWIRLLSSFRLRCISVSARGIDERAINMHYYS